MLSARSHACPNICLSKQLRRAFGASGNTASASTRCLPVCHLESCTDSRKDGRPYGVFMEVQSGKLLRFEKE